MTNKVQKIKQEIERLKEHTAKCGYPGQGEFENGNREGRNWVCDKLLSFIDSLPEEPANEDLEEAVSQYIKENKCYETDDVETDIVAQYITEKAFKAGAEWQKQKDEKTIGL